MSEQRFERIKAVATELNIGLDRAIEFLNAKGFSFRRDPNAKINEEQYKLLLKEFGTDLKDKKEASNLFVKKSNDNLVIESQPYQEKKQEEPELFIKNIGIESKHEQIAHEVVQTDDSNKILRSNVRLEGPKILGKIDLTSQKSDGKKSIYAAKPPVIQSKLDFDTPPANVNPKNVVDEPNNSAISSEKEVVSPFIDVTEPNNEDTNQQNDNIVPNHEVVAPTTENVLNTDEHSKHINESVSPVHNEIIANNNDLDVNDNVSVVNNDYPLIEHNKLDDNDNQEINISTNENELVETNTKEESSAFEENEIEENVIKPVVEETQLIEAKADTLKGLTVLGRMELTPEKPKAPKENFRYSDERKKRKRIKLEVKPNTPLIPVKDEPRTPRPANVNDPNRSNTPGTNVNLNNNRPNNVNNRPNNTNNRPNNTNNRPNTTAANNANKPKEEITDKQIQEQIKNTLARLSGGNKSGANRAKYRKDKRNAYAEAEEGRLQQAQDDANIIKVTEFISANDMASMMDVSVNKIIAACMSLGMFVSINQRLDAETISIIAEEFNFKAEFTTAEDEISVEDTIDEPEDLETRAPIVTIMGHVDHGKTSLLDYIRKSNVTSQEAGGITQHIGAYDVLTESNKRITFLDTPGHEAFTAMRARGAKVTDIVIIVVAADDGVMPQTKEAINHALVAGVPIIIAINKIDKPGANPEKIKEQLSIENILVEDWGGKYQCEMISAKSGKGVPDLLEKVLLEAEILDLKANPNKNASGTVIEAALDKGRGYVTTILVQGGTLNVGDIVLAGQHYGRVKAMNDHKGTRLKTAGPAKPVQILGLPGAPQAGDKFNVMTSESEARDIANKREQILREQSIRTKKHITLDEIGRRLAIGNFQQLNVIIKADFDGSIQALSDSLLKLSTNEIHVAIIHKGVGAISESDVLLASASDAVVIGFQVRPSVNAKRLAEQEQIEIRLYSIIYDAINDLKDAMEGMLAPKIEETILGTAEVREAFKISKVGTIAGCMVMEGNIKRNAELRLLRDNIVVFTGKFASLKRFKDDVSEVKTGQDCGIGIHNYNDIQVGDMIEVFEKREVKRKL
jgi:translation initiation factor IF-2